ncbi:MAG: hypothetical protein WD557_12890 [Dehalococcoidia bacterium]
MTDSRWAGLAAIVFAVLLVVGMVLPGDAPTSDEADSEYVDYYEDSGNQRLLIASVYVITLSSLALVAFATLQFRSGSALASLARAMAVVAATAFAIGSVALATVGAEILINDAEVDPGVARFLPSMGFGTMLIVGGLAASAMIAAISADWLRSGAMPRWLCWLGFACAVVLLAGVIFLPMIALVLWAVVTGIVLLRPTSATAVPATA